MMCVPLLHNVKLTHSQRERERILLCIPPPPSIFVFVKKNFFSLKCNVMESMAKKRIIHYIHLMMMMMIKTIISSVSVVFYIGFYFFQFNSNLMMMMIVQEKIFLFAFFIFLDSIVRIFGFFGKFSLSFFQFSSFFGTQTKMM